ncbi:T6SS effector BTH_I2691 family protein [uncultured Pseudomonas sp.]|uniref:T6SS effector BTH_I2691 family protein n=1 Tax=uncultured Pseudomonas sp. TaxID=114707 RepID=UPI0025DB74F8|nr:T6SS effector BTH_I2691 family protein [uncultured Pseudomonas sp.]
MTDKTGNRRQRLASCFDKTPASGTSTCPFKGPDIAIVPVRYALDRSRHDSNPDALKPLPAQGRWTVLPQLQTRPYTLRQLQDGYLYVFDETAKTLHEYRYRAKDACLTRIIWSDAHIGQDQRKPKADQNSDAKPYLLYPRKHVLHIAYAPMQWTWRICEHLRSHEGSRAQWMKRLDLAAYSLSMNEPDTLPLSELALAVADIDAGQVTEDARFADTSVPTQAPPEAPTKGQKPNWVAVGADVHWLGSVPDKDSALLIALDDPLAVLQDLGLQLAADQAAYHVWQEEHEHRIQIANIVSQLCGLPSEPKEKLPEAVRGDPGRTQAYLLEAEAYLVQWKMDRGDIVPHPPSEDGTEGLYESSRLFYALRENYRSQPTDSDFLEWKERDKWRREVDLPGARRYLQQQYATKKTLLDRVKQTQADFKRWSNHISLDPLKLFIDTSNPRTLFYLKELMLHLAEIFVQGEDPILWMLKQEQNATTLFGTLRYGFSPELKEALQQESGKLIDGFSDIANIASRAGELNSVLNHTEFANSPLMNTLKQPARDTFAALQTLTRSGTDAMAALTEKLLMVFTPIDARLAAGEHQNLPALLRNLLMGQVLINSPNSLKIDRDIAGKLHEWKQERANLHQQLQSLQRRWFITEPSNRKGLTHELESLMRKAQAHDTKIPALLDYHNGRYTTAVTTMMSDFIAQGKTTAADWNAHKKQWMQSRGLSLSSGFSVGVIFINLINTALVTKAATHDGKVSSPELIKIGYNLGYTANLFMSLFVDAPWSIIKEAPAIRVGNNNLSLLERSAHFWKAQGHAQLSKTVSAFRARIFATGLFLLTAALLELMEIQSDLSKAKDSEERNLLRIKSAFVMGMGVAGFLQITSAPTVVGKYTSRIVGNVIFFIVAVVLGLGYLATSLALNKLKRDALGTWLAKCSWSIHQPLRYSKTPEGRLQEKEDFREIELSPLIFSKSTYYDPYAAGDTMEDTPTVQNGAWIQVLIPGELRGQYVNIEICSTRQFLAAAPQKKIEENLNSAFFHNGEFKSDADWGHVENERPSTHRSAVWPKLEYKQSVIWEVWVPLDKHAEYMEMQIWYPENLFQFNKKDRAYRFHIKLKTSGSIHSDGLTSPDKLITYKKDREGTEKIWIIP